MQIRVLAIGPKDLEKLITTIGTEYEEIAMDYITYHFEEEVTDLVKRYEKDYDVLFFAGSLPYSIVKNHTNLDKRMVYIEFKGTSLYRVLFQLVRESQTELFSGKLRLSIDNLEKLEVEECFDELNIQYENLYYYENNLQQDTEKAVEFHYDLWKNRQIDRAITCVGSVYERLVELEVPASRIVPTRSSIRTGLDKVLMEGISLRQLHSQIATGIIQWDQGNENSHSTEYEYQRKILELKNILIDYGEKLQAIIKWIDHKQEVKFITTRGALAFEQGNSSNELKLLKEIFQKTEIKPRMGIGIGRTTHEAEIYAREALTKSLEDRLTFFVRDIDGMIHGPIGEENHLSYSIRNDNRYLIDVAKQAKLSGSTISRILSFSNGQGDSLTTADLASGLGITIRSARRILNKLEQANLAAVIGEEQPVARGRPRQLYSLKPLSERIHQG